VHEDEAAVEERPMHDAEAAHAPANSRVAHTEADVSHTRSSEAAAVSGARVADGERKHRCTNSSE
jgi:hypothetical protein